MFRHLNCAVIHVSCRDRIVRLVDLNGDGLTDRYDTFNDDHQVTEHFHEFAMGLETDTDGNLFYAKSARHALPAVVPHHGTLLKVSRDGSATEIVATGFRAANGVCVESDGTFWVTDQEGHWNPKNRINHVRPGGFYGNMFGYHDVTDSSDAAMEPPAFWITNAFDRSPAELLRVTSPQWSPLTGSLLELSYGEGRIHLVLTEPAAGEPALPDHEPSADEQEIYSQPITELSLSVRARKCTTKLGIATIGELVRRTAEDLMECKNFGVTSLNEVREKLAERGLRLRGE